MRLTPASPFSFVAVALLLSSSANALSIVAPTEPSAQPVQILRQVTYYEDYLAIFLRQFRQYAGEKPSISKADIELAKKRQDAAIRAQLIQQLLQADLDGNGSITRQEAQDYFSQRNANNVDVQVNQWFTTYDSNGDQVISYEEMRAPTPQSRRAPYINTQTDQLLVFDANKDGTVTLDEIRSETKKIFEKYDTNKDGILSEAEKQALQPYRPDGSANNVPAEPLPITNGAELHAVGVYEGDTGKNGVVHGPVVNIKLERPGKKVALLLTSYDAVRWNITTDGKTTVTEAYVSALKQPASEVLVDGKIFAKAKPKRLVMTYESKGTRFRQLLDYVKQATGRDRLASFHGQYTAPESPFIIQEVSNEPDLKQVRLTPVPANKLPDITFTATLNGQPGIYTLSGKLVKTLPASLARATYVDSQKAYYALSDNGVNKLDAAGNVIEAIPVSLDVPPFSSPTDITYNPARNQLVVSSLGGEGFLYRYDLASKRWSASSLNNKDYGMFRYDAATTHYIGADSLGGNSINFVGEGGNVVENIAIDLTALPGFSDLFDSGNGRGGVGIIPTKDYLVILVGSAHPFFSGQASRIYLYDRRTKQAQLTYAPEQPTSAVLH